MTKEEIDRFWREVKVANLQPYTTALTMDHVEKIYQAFEYRVLQKIKSEAATNIFPHIPVDEA